MLTKESSAFIFGLQMSFFSYEDCDECGDDEDEADDCRTLSD